MAKPAIDNLIAEVNKTDEVVESATLLINGIADRVATAVAKALENGATAAELAPLNAEVAELRAKADALAAAVLANT